MSGARTERIQTIVIGAGQAGLSVGYHLKRRGLPFIILDAHKRVGDAWRTRWDSLRLFTPARFDGLTDALPAPRHSSSKDDMGNYLESYAKHFDLPVRSGVRVDGLSRQGKSFLVTAGDQQFEAENVVAAMSNFQKSTVPPFAKELDPSIVQVHSYDYRNPAQVQKGGVLLVGGGNSGADIGMELVQTHDVWLSGRDSGPVPFRIDGLLARLFLYKVILRFVFHRVLTVRTPMGRKARPKAITQGGPLIRVKSQDLEHAGVKRVPKTVGVKDGLPLLEDGRVLNVTNVIWCTGFSAGFSWIPSPDSRAGRADARGRDRPTRARSVLRGARVSLFILFCDDPRRRAGRGSDRRRHCIAHRRSRIARVAR
jgi:putative flavoprotein involved in K+ transport